MRRSNSSPSVSLFPFLAVLVCAMGALILLLLVTTRKMRQVAVARAAAEEAAAEEASNPPAMQPAEKVPAEPEPIKPVESESPPVGPQLVATGPTLEELAQKEAERRAVRVAREARRRLNEEAKQRQAERVQEWQRMLAELETRREAQREKLRDSKSVLNELKGRLQRTETNLKKLQDRQLQLETKKEQDAEERAKIEKQHQELADAITEAQKEMAELRKAHANEASKFAFIPYDGASGTTRRPIYLECTAAGIRFQPDGILLDEEDLKGFTESQNPLLSATQAVIEHWQKNPAQNDDPRRPRRPYILLLVRPSGTISYYVARKMLTEMGEEFGYELIEDDFPLQLPTNDPRTKAIIQGAIADSLRHRGEALAEGSRVGAPRLNSAMMGRSEDPIEFGSLKGQVAAAAAEKESPFAKHSTRMGKNFSITRSPVRADELLPDRTDSDSERQAQNQGAGGTNLAGPGGRGGNGTGPRGAAGAGTGSGTGTGTGAGAGSGTGDGSGDAVAIGQAGGPGKNANGLAGYPGVEIQRGRGRRNQLGNSNGTDSTGSNGTPGRIPQLPKLTDPFSRQSLAQGAQKGVATDADAGLGFSGGVDQSGGTGAGRGSGQTAGVPVGSEFADAGSDSAPGTGNQSGEGDGTTGTRGGTGTRARGKLVQGARSASVFDLQPGAQLADQGSGAGGAGADSPEAGAAGDAVQGAKSGTAGDQPNGVAANAGPGATAGQRGRGMMQPGAAGASAGALGGGQSDIDLNVSPSKSPGGASGQANSGQTSARDQQQSSSGTPQNGTRSQSGSGRKSPGAKNAFDKTQGAVVAQQFTEEAQRQVAEGSGSSGASSGSQKARKSYGDNPQDDEVAQRNKPKPKLTPTQKQDYGRQRWGGNNVGQIGFERKIPVQVLADKIILGKNEVEIEIEPGTTRDELVDSILAGLDANSETWGTPPKKFYWVPYLQFEVYKGGVVQYEQVHAPLREWGLFSDVKFKDGLPGEHGLIRPVSKSELQDAKKVTPPVPAAKKKAVPK
ncbi:MAG: hypothetical protein JWM11_1434 [Planctomycetaceae bacterium]|nr:hypothetical protein [Planctomycetaceae bacterium]